MSGVEGPTPAQKAWMPPPDARAGLLAARGGAALVVAAGGERDQSGGASAEFGGEFQGTDHGRTSPSRQYATL